MISHIKLDRAIWFSDLVFHDYLQGSKQKTYMLVCKIQITANKKFSLRYFMNIFSINGWCFQYRLPLLHQFKHSWYYPPHLFRRLERKFWLWLFCKNMKHSLLLKFLPFVHFSGDHKYQHFLDTKWSFA